WTPSTPYSARCAPGLSFTFRRRFFCSASSPCTWRRSSSTELAVARFLKPGTPERTSKYVFPSPARRKLILAGLGAGAVLAVSLVGLDRAGMRPVASPGPVASAHAPLGARCDSCHSAGQPSDLRCERCHDPAGHGGFRVPAHARFGQEWTAELA